MSNFDPFGEAPIEDPANIPFLDGPQEETTPPPAPEPGEPVVIKDVHLPVTLSFDASAFAHYLLYGGEWDGSPDNPPEPEYLPGIRDAIQREVVSAIRRDIEQDIKRSVLEILKTEAQNQVAVIIDDLIQGQIPITNNYGERTGKTTTLRELIMEQVNDTLTRKVTRNGSAARNYDNDAQPYVVHVAQKEAKAVVDKELKAAVDQAVAQVKKAVSDQTATTLSEQIMRGLSRTL
jgi:hypothetical protein